MNQNFNLIFFPLGVIIGLLIFIAFIKDTDTCTCQDCQREYLIEKAKENEEYPFFI